MFAVYAVSAANLPDISGDHVIVPVYCSVSVIVIILGTGQTLYYTDYAPLAAVPEAIH